MTLRCIICNTEATYLLGGTSVCDFDACVEDVSEGVAHAVAVRNLTAAARESNRRQEREGS